MFHVRFLGPAHVDRDNVALSSTEFRIQGAFKAFAGDSNTERMNAATHSDGISPI